VSHSRAHGRVEIGPVHRVQRRPHRGRQQPPGPGRDVGAGAGLLAGPGGVASQRRVLPAGDLLAQPVLQLGVAREAQPGGQPQHRRPARAGPAGQPRDRLQPGHRVVGQQHPRDAPLGGGSAGSSWRSRSAMASPVADMGRNIPCHDHFGQYETNVRLRHCLPRPGTRQERHPRPRLSRLPYLMTVLSVLLEGSPGGHAARRAGRRRVPCGQLVTGCVPVTAEQPPAVPGPPGQPAASDGPSGPPPELPRTTLLARRRRRAAPAAPTGTTLPPAPPGVT
jgi:hypothetical protein